MKKYFFFFICCALFWACNSAEKKQKEQELREQELILQEKERTLQEKGGIKVDENASIPSDPNAPKNKTQNQPQPTTAYKTHHPCSFSVSLPANYDLQNMDPDEKSPDYCDFHVKDADGSEIVIFGSLLNSRFQFNTIAEAYKAALQSSDLDITYKVQKDNWFVISGFRKKNRNVVYWKRVLGARFVSDLTIDFPESKRSQIEPHIARISKSFVSE